jgi:hypothetical protein
MRDYLFFLIGSTDTANDGMVVFQLGSGNLGDQRLFFLPLSSSHPSSFLWKSANTHTSMSKGLRSILKDGRHPDILERFLIHTSPPTVIQATAVCEQVSDPNMKLTGRSVDYST